MLDAETILEQARRRDQAMLAGSTHIPLALRAQPGPLPGAESPNERPLLRWPSERHLAPTRCHHCGGRALETDAPYGLVKSGETRCLLCTRCVVRWRADNTERAPLPSEDLRPRPGRPPTRLDRSCDDCGAPCRGSRCQPCMQAHLAQWPKLVAFLADGQPHKAGEILAALGISDASLRQFVQYARKAGHVIRTGLPIGTYRLEVEP